MLDRPIEDHEKQEQEAYNTQKVVVSRWNNAINHYLKVVRYRDHQCLRYECQSAEKSKAFEYATELSGKLFELHWTSLIPLNEAFFRRTLDCNSRQMDPYVLNFDLYKATVWIMQDGHLTYDTLKDDEVG